MELTRKQIIDNLSYIADSMPDDACGEWRDSLAYAISSLKTDEAYQIMYEGGEIFTKADLVAMFTELQFDIEKHTMTSGVTNQGTWNECIACCNRVIQQKINSLRENTDGNK